MLAGAHALRLPRGPLRAAAVLLILFSAAASARGPAGAVEEPGADGEAVIPAGREEMLAGMLGRGGPLAAGCTFSGGQVEYSVVRATYTCPAGEVVYELSHPAAAAAPAARTERFALTPVSGSPPDALTAALIARLRGAESAFEWQWVARPRSSSRTWAGPFVAAALLAVAVLGWLVRRRASGERPQPGR
jgi:hypothetical protein